MSDAIGDKTPCSGCEERAALMREMWDAATNKDADKFNELGKQFSQSLFNDAMTKIGLRRKTPADVQRLGIREIGQRGNDA